MLLTNFQNSALGARLRNRLDQVLLLTSSTQQRIFQKLFPKKELQSTMTKYVPTFLLVELPAFLLSFLSLKDYIRVVLGLDPSSYGTFDWFLVLTTAFLSASINKDLKSFFRLGERIYEKEKLQKDGKGGQRIATLKERMLRDGRYGLRFVILYFAMSAITGLGGIIIFLWFITMWIDYDKNKRESRYTEKVDE